MAGEHCDQETLEWARSSLKVPVLDHWWQTGIYVQNSELLLLSQPYFTISDLATKRNQTILVKSLEEKQRLENI